MRRIWKVPLRTPANRELLPGCEKILAVELQDGTPTVWFVHDPDRPDGYAAMLFTGHDVKYVDVQSYRKTFVLDFGTVVHVFAKEG